MAELKSKDEILAQREKELSEKAKVESANEGNLPKYETVTKRLYETNQNLVDGAMDKLMELYVDNLRNEGKKAAGFGTKVYKALNDYLRDDCFGFKEATKELGNEALEKLVQSYIGVDAKSLDKELESEVKLTVNIVDQLKNQVAKSLTQKLNSACIDSIRETAAGDVDGFRKYVTNLAKEQKVEFNQNETQSIEGLFNIYLQAAQELLNEKLQKKRR